MHTPGRFLSILLVVSFSLISCDSGGTEASTPEWIGNWEVVSRSVRFVNPIYWRFNRQELERVEDLGSECEIRRFEVLQERGDSILAREKGAEAPEDTLDFSLNVEDERLETEVRPFLDLMQVTIIAERIDERPREAAAGCQTAEE